MAQKYKENTNKQGRKWQLTINNPEEKNLTHDIIQKKLFSLKSLLYFCCSDEVGKKETLHTHVFVVYQSPKLFSTIKNLFPQAHIEIAHGTCLENKDYVYKTGKWKDTEKASTSIPGTQFEYGDMPEERQCPKPEMSLLYELIRDGYSNYEILNRYPEYILNISSIERCRLVLRQEQYKNSFRKLNVTYIFGKTGTGKTRGVMEEYGYENVFRVTDYVHPFDTYDGQDILLLEEFNSSLRIQDLLNYLDGYPLKLPSRYSDKTACFTKVYFTTNTPLEMQYPNVKVDSPEVWNALMRRIHKIVWYKSEQDIKTYNSVEEYLDRDLRKECPFLPEKGKYEE